jgi:four helix bundle protein
MNYDLEERTAKFGEKIILFIKCLKDNSINMPLINQLVRSSTSVGANYMEANQASSRKDFINKIRICQKESNESKHWLRMVAVANNDYINDYRLLWKEAHELTLIFAKITRNCKKENL